MYIVTMFWGNNSAILIEIRTSIHTLSSNPTFRRTFWGKRKCLPEEKAMCLKMGFLTPSPVSLPQPLPRLHLPLVLTSRPSHPLANPAPGTLASTRPQNTPRPPWGSSHAALWPLRSSFKPRFFREAPPDCSRMVWVPVMLHYVPAVSPMALIILHILFHSLYTCWCQPPPQSR